MINQVIIEGFVVSRWQYKGEEFLRIAHHRPRREGELLHSDYVTIRVDREVDDLPNLQQGDIVHVQGEVWGKDILESLGRVLRKARLNFELPEMLENLVVPRPTAYVLALEVRLVDPIIEANDAAKERAGRWIESNHPNPGVL